MQEVLRTYRCPNEDSPLFIGVDQREAAQFPTVTYFADDEGYVDSFINGIVITLENFLPEQYTRGDYRRRFLSFFTKDAIENHIWDMDDSTFTTTQDTLVSDLEPVFDLSVVQASLEVPRLTLLKKPKNPFEDVILYALFPARKLVTNQLS